jgi:hypothetical protein
MTENLDGVQRLRTLISAGKSDEAVTEARRMILVDAANPDVHHLLGVALAGLGRVEDSLDSLDAAIDIRVTHENAQRDLRTLLAHRGRASGRYSITVITPTIGTPYLAKAIESVQAQTYGRVEHVIIVDGPAGADAVQAMLPKAPRHPVHVITLPFNTGAGGFNGHRIYGAAVFLVSGRYVAFLDEDNWFEPDHLSRLMNLIEVNGLEWAYSLRQLVDCDGLPIGPDDCESLGRWPSWEGADIHVVDFSCYLVRRDFLLRYSMIFHRRYRDEMCPDIALCNLLLAGAPNFACSGAYSLNYMIGRSEKSVKAEFFRIGNEYMSLSYDGKPFPWREPSVMRGPAGQ